MLSHWLDEAPLAAEDEAPALEGDRRADVCIIGGGFCGLWTALRLKQREPALDIVIVEKDRCGDGASGRNGGFVLSWWAKFGALKKFCAADEAARLAEASANSMKEMADFCTAHAIDAQLRHDGWLWAATNQAQDGAWHALIDELNRQQLHPFEEWTPAEVAARSGSDKHVSGVYEPTAATVQPALLARGLRRVAREKGIRIFENTPMRQLKRSRPPCVVTPTGKITADKVVIAMNAWATQFPELRRSVVVISSDIVTTEAFPERLKSSGWSDGLAISDSRTLVNYYRTTPDGRVAFGTGGGFLSYANRVGTKFNGGTPRAQEVTGYFRQIYPDFKDVGIATHWTGPIDRSLSGLPFFGRLGGRADILYGLGFSGNGVGPTLVGAKILASLVLNERDEWSECGLVRDGVGQFPREPLRYFGGAMVIGANRRKEALQDQGKNPGPVTKYIASLAPAGLVPVKGINAPAD
ncbi:MAG: FAD-binding oxidoreductase [Alphaproteobacteria bacterium]